MGSTESKRNYHSCKYVSLDMEKTEKERRSVKGNNKCVAFAGGNLCCGGRKGERFSS